MRPTFAGWRRWALVEFAAVPEVGDVVLAARPDQPEQRLIKRVTGRDASGWWIESDAGTADAVRADSWLFGPVADDRVLGVVRWPRVRR